MERSSKEMAEEMRGLKRSHRCTEVNNSHIGQIVTVMGWVQKSRNKGSIIFVDLRDRTGILQIIFEESDIGEEGFSKAGQLRSEFVIGCRKGGKKGWGSERRFKNRRYRNKS